MNDNIILGVFLLTLAVSGNFIAESLNCKTQTILTTNMYVKNLILLLIIYFSLGLVSVKTIKPTEYFKDTLIIWVLFLIYNKMTPLFTLITFLFLFATLVCMNWIEYYNNKNKVIKNKEEENKEENNPEEDNNIEENKKQINKLTEIQNYLTYSIFGSLTVGFLLYFKKQYTDHYKNFNVLTFIFGKVKCDSH